MTNFLDALEAGEASWDEVDDWVEAWHDGDSSEELQEFLGFTEEQYNAWAENPSSFIKSYEAERKSGLS